MKHLMLSLRALALTWLMVAAQASKPPTFEIVIPLGGEPTHLINDSLSATPAIDPDFNVHNNFGTDRINGLNAYLTGLQATRELALKTIRGRVAERDYNYDASDVSMHIRGVFLPLRSMLQAAGDTLLSQVSTRIGAGGVTRNACTA